MPSSHLLGTTFAFFLLFLQLSSAISSPPLLRSIDDAVPSRFWRRDDAEASAEYAKDDDFRKAVLNATNTYRGQHNATGLRWNESLAKTAQEWSEGCVFEHSGGPTGENLASGYANASASIIAWGEERNAYDFKKGDFSKEVGHFTQMVWKGTAEVGCGRTRCDGKKKKKGKGDAAPGWYVVCEYWPAGNVLEQFTQNVQPQVSNSNEPAEEGEVPTSTSSPGAPSAEPSQCPMGGVCSSGERTRIAPMMILWAGILGSVLLGSSL